MAKKKLAVFIGSLRKDSYNRKIYETYKELASNEFEFHEIEVAKLPHYDADLDQAGECKDILESMDKAIRDASGVLFFSPEYNYSVPGFLKNGLDWISRLKDQPLAGKKAAIIGASPGKIGTARMQYHLRQIGVFLNLSFMNSPEVMVSQVHELFDQEGRLSDQKTEEFLKKHIQVFSEFIQS